MHSGSDARRRALARAAHTTSKENTPHVHALLTGPRKTFFTYFVKAELRYVFTYFLGGFNLARPRREWARLGRGPGVDVGGGPLAGVLRR